MKVVITYLVLNFFIVIFLFIIVHVKSENILHAQYYSTMFIDVMP